MVCLITGGVSAKPYKKSPKDGKCQHYVQIYYVFFEWLVVAFIPDHTLINCISVLMNLNEYELN